MNSIEKSISLSLYFPPSVLFCHSCYMLVVGSTAFKLLKLGQIFQVAFHKLLIIACWNSVPFLLTELVWKRQVCRPPCLHMLFQFCSLSLRVRWTVWQSLQNLDSGVLKLICCNFESALMVIVHERPICIPHDSIDFMKHAFTSTAKHHTTWCCHLCASQVRWW